MVKKVTLPKHMKPQAQHFAEIHCEILGLGKKDRGYTKEFKKAFENFCYEAYMHSMTPSGQLGQNPSTPKIAEKYIGSFDKLVAEIKVPKENRAMLVGQIKSVIISLTHAYLTIHQDEINIDVKGGSDDKGKLKGFHMVDWPDGSQTLVRKWKGGKIDKTKHSSFEYTADMEGQYDKLVQVEKNRYSRTFIATVITMTVFKLITATLGTKNIISRNYIPSLDDADLEGTPESDKRLFAKLKEEKTRMTFIQNVAKAVDINIGMKNLIVVEKKTRVFLKDLEEFTATFDSNQDAYFESHGDSDTNKSYFQLATSKNKKNKTRSSHILTKRIKLYNDEEMDFDGIFYSPKLLDVIAKIESGKAKTKKVVIKLLKEARYSKLSDLTFEEWKEAIAAMISDKYWQWLEKKRESDDPQTAMKFNPKRKRR